MVERFDMPNMVDMADMADMVDMVDILSKFTMVERFDILLK